MAGYISLHRKIQNHWLWPKDRPFTEFEAWVWLLLNAVHATHKERVNGRLITLNQGEIATSERSLSRIWGWSRRRASGFLKSLEEAGMILTQNWGAKWATLKITNYGHYQNKNVNSEPQKEPEKAPQKTPETAPETTPQPLPKAALDGLSTQSIIMGNKENNLNKKGAGAPNFSQQETTKPEKPKDLVFGAGLEMLIGAGTPESSARTLLGKLIRDYSKEAVAEAIETALVENPVDPKGYLVGVLKSRKTVKIKGIGGNRRDKLEKHKAWLEPVDCARQGCMGCQEEYKGYWELKGAANGR